MVDVDEGFWDRADAHIHLSNAQISDDVGAGKVSASHMYSMARFAAWLSWTGFDSAQDMRDKRDETIEYFLLEFEKMLKENLKDYESNFEKYRQK